LEKLSKDIWDELNKLFGEKAVNEKISLKLKLFRFKIHVETTMPIYINNLKLLIGQLEKVGAKVEDEDAKSLVLNSFPSTYTNVMFTLSHMSLQFLDDMISSFFAKEKRLNEGDSESDPHKKRALLSRNRMGKKEKEDFKCYYYRKLGHKA
jgi:hypothetical protein